MNCSVTSASPFSAAVFNPTTSPAGSCPAVVLVALRPLGKVVLDDVTGAVVEAEGDDVTVAGVCRESSAGEAEGKFCAVYVVIYSQSNASFAGKLKPFSTNLTNTFCFELGK